MSAIWKKISLFHKLYSSARSSLSTLPHKNSLLSQPAVAVRVDSSPSSTPLLATWSLVHSQIYEKCSKINATLANAEPNSMELENQMNRNDQTICVGFSMGDHEGTQSNSKSAKVQNEAKVKWSTRLNDNSNCSMWPGRDDDQTQSKFKFYSSRESNEPKIDANNRKWFRVR